MWTWLRDERGSALMFTTVMLLMLLIFGGLAVDLAYVFAAKGELQRSVDAASLAGAGKLAFDNTVFDTVRTWAQNFAGLNPYRHPSNGAVNLGLNAGNAPNGDIVLGVWQNGSFQLWDSGADPNGVTVNAVRCRYQTQVPMPFLGLLGIPQMTVAAMSVAVSNPPATIGCGEPLLPLAVTQCNFRDGNTGAFSSQGCGTGLQFIRSNRECNNEAGSPQSCNTATWASMDGSSTPNAPYLRDAIRGAGSPGGNCGNFVDSGQTTPTNNGMLDAVFRELADVFLANRVQPLPNDVCGPGGCGNGIVYPREGGGWRVAVLMIETACPPGPMSGEHRVLTYARFVVTQVFYKQDGCVVQPNPDPQAQAYCYNEDGTPRRDNDFRALFGYFECDRLGETAAREPLPRAAVAPRMRIVQ